jgi:DNA-binding CsgD family transcriptional regulator
MNDAHALAAVRHASAAVAGAVPFGLTAHELEVLRLVASGRSDREIAAAAAHRLDIVDDP